MEKKTMASLSKLELAYLNAKAEFIRVKQEIEKLESQKSGILGIEPYRYTTHNFDFSEHDSRISSLKSEMHTTLASLRKAELAMLESQLHDMKDADDGDQEAFFYERLDDLQTRTRSLRTAAGVELSV